MASTEIKKVSRNELSWFKSLIQIFIEVFENEIEVPCEEHLQTLLDNRDFLVFVALVNNKVVGGLTIYILHQYYTAKPLAFIYDVGIKKDYQKQGLGKKLIAEVCTFCQANEFDAAFVAAEIDDLEAVNFYRQTNCNNETVARHFTYSF